jgi:uncharacterized protein involved in tolerance to divalent cations
MERIRKSHSFTIPYAACIQVIGTLAAISEWKANIQEADVGMGLVSRKGADYQVALTQLRTSDIHPHFARTLCKPCLNLSHRYQPDISV